jgi:hypothetical protein
MIPGIVALAFVSGATRAVWLNGQNSTALPSGWPDLKVLKDYPNPFGNECPAEGKNRDGRLSFGDKAKQNVLKNRFTLPAKFSPMTFDQFLQLPAKYDERWETKAVTVEAYVADVKRGGTRGESANCGATGSGQVDCHIDFTKNGNTSGPQHVIVGEVTERIRRLAAAGKLSFTKGNRTITDWSTPNLRREMLGRRVKISGYLFMDKDHMNEDWVTDPNDDQGNPNWRATTWEIHPVMKIEIL